ncbi:hypothetical protein BSKO_03974 [Bryopsis sp. KO-2023]|nr:hypothetical protein BSKO_03974 [Bryopsis sp. KO-2023]
MTAESCTLPYPERFRAATQYVSNPPQGSATISDDVRLVLFALLKQATEGPCKEPKPWGWNMVESAKWQSWSQLGNMSKEEAMRLYVRTLEEVQPNWWGIGSNPAPAAPQQTAAPTPAPADAPSNLAPATNGGGPSSEQRLSEAAAEGSWSTPYLDGASKPAPRYEHGMAVMGSKMFVIGGNSAGGRYLNDIWLFDFAALEWSQASTKSPTGPSPPPSSEPDAPPPPPPPPLPPIAGHEVVVWKNSLLVIGGHVKSKDATGELMVRVLDPQSMNWSILEPSGPAPTSRGGHTATLFGSKLFVFGGEDLARRPLGDLNILDLETMSWSQPEMHGRVPSARSGHVCVAVDDFMVIFGGGSLAHCFNDTCVLDTQTMTWHKTLMHGRLPSPRAGHSASLLGTHWYVVGGGNNSAGCTDMAFLDVLPVADKRWLGEERVEGVEREVQLSWTIVGTIPERSYIASEGMSLVTVASANVLVSFGGYNGKYSNALSLFRPHGNMDGRNKASPQTPPKEDEVNSSRSPQPKTAGERTGGGSPTDMQSKLEAAWREAENASREAAAAKESAAHELALMRRQLMSAQTSLDEKEKAFETAKAQLQAEQSKSFKLEAEIAELRHQLQNMGELEKELEMYRRQAQEAEKKGAGIWGWVGGQS